MSHRDIKTGYDNTGGQVGLSPSEEASIGIPVPLHPDVLRVPLAPSPRDPVGALQTFDRRLARVLQSDYGDWMREANLAWHELYQALAPRSSILERQLQDMHDIIQYRPSWRPLETCREILLYSRQIQSQFGAPGGDVDFHRFDIGFTEPETQFAYYEMHSPFPEHHVPRYPPE